MNVFGGILNAAAGFTEIPDSGYSAGFSIPVPPQRFQSYYSNGTGVDQVDGFSPMEIPLHATPVVINLSNLIGYLGNPLTVARIPLLAIKIVDQTPGNLLLVGDAGAGEYDGFLSSGSILKVYPSSTANDGYTILSAPGVDAPPISSGGNSSVLLNWPIVAGATGYKIYRSTTTGGESSSPALIANIGSGSTTTYTDIGTTAASGAVPGSNTATLPAFATPFVSIANSSGGTFVAAVPQYYKITALTAAGESTPSNEVSAGISATDDVVTFHWTPIAGAIGYNIYRTVTIGVYTTPAFLATVGPGASSFVDTGTAVSAGTTPGSNNAKIAAPALTAAPDTTGGSLAGGNWFYKITSVTAAGESTGSSEQSVSTLTANNLLKLDPGSGTFSVILLAATRSV